MKMDNELTREAVGYMVSVHAFNSSAILSNACFTFKNCFCDMLFEPATTGVSPLFKVKKIRVNPFNLRAKK